MSYRLTKIDARTAPVPASHRTTLVLSCPRVSLSARNCYVRISPRINPRRCKDSTGGIFRYPVVLASILGASYRAKENNGSTSRGDSESEER